MDTTRQKQLNDMQRMNPRKASKRGAGSFITVPFQWYAIDSSGTDQWHTGGSIASELRSLYADIIRQPLPENIGRLASSLGKSENWK